MDQNKVSSMVAGIVGLEVAEFADDNPKNYGEYGLADPHIKIELNDNQAFSLYLGNHGHLHMLEKKLRKKPV